MLKIRTAQNCSCFEIVLRRTIFKNFPEAFVLDSFAVSSLNPCMRAHGKHVEKKEQHVFRAPARKMKFIGRAVQGPPDHGSWTKFVHQVPKRAHKRVALKHRGIFTETSTKHVDGLQMLLPQHVCEMIDDDSSCQLPAKGNCLELTRDKSQKPSC